ncbi:hypothetical protein [Moorena sp. SIO4G3]|nr:hypothetical protein [Moorena sp. SIO4G3]NEO81129.1 hypothetical protein [Moorena sp. SIO4G3]
MLRLTHPSKLENYSYHNYRIAFAALAIRVGIVIIFDTLFPTPRSAFI